MKYIIYKSLLDLNSLKQDIDKSVLNNKLISGNRKRKTILNHIKRYEDGIEDAKKRKASAPEIATKEDERKAKLYKVGSKSIKYFTAIPVAVAMSFTGAPVTVIDMSDYYLDPRVYITKNDFDRIIKELTACKKYLEGELKQLESCYSNAASICESIFDFEFE